MRHDEADARDLVATALATFRETVLPAVPAEQRFTALMVANALAIAERELAIGIEPDRRLAEAMAALLGQDGDAGALASRLCAAIEAGDFDAPERQRALMGVLWQWVRQRLALSNPKYLQAAGR